MTTPTPSLKLASKGHGFHAFHTGNQCYVSILEENKSNLIESIIVLDEGNCAKENIAKSM
jgi:hypothetical protein